MREIRFRDDFHPRCFEGDGHCVDVEIVVVQMSMCEHAFWTAENGLDAGHAKGRKAPVHVWIEVTKLAIDVPIENVGVDHPKMTAGRWL